jgi:hypothetical protein
VGLLHWVSTNLQLIITDIGIIGGLLFTGFQMRSEAKTRRVANLLTVTANHREIWHALFAHPQLNRVLDRNPSSKTKAATESEEIFVITVITAGLSHQASLTNIIKSHQSSITEIIRTIASRNVLSDRVASILTKLPMLMKVGPSKENEAALRNAFLEIKQEEPTFFRKMIGEFASVPSSVMADIASSWVQSIITSFVK